MTNNAADADDLVQETFLKAFRFWDKYEKGTNIRAWLFRIMKNSYINRYRREAKEPDTVDYEEIQNFYNTIRDEKSDSHDMPESAFGNLLDDDLAGAISALPEDFRRSRSSLTALWAPCVQGCTGGVAFCVRG
jgi:RNA polymerase sigma-70 factor (ECF subfamily)